jgi:hypothetical protein
MLHGVSASASCNDGGSATNPAARAVATAKMDAIKTVDFFILKEDMKAFVYLGWEGYCFFLAVDISGVVNLEYQI